ncbi:MAG: putative exporter [Kiritimatiellia bacterium]|jgi:predicted exporter
MTLPTICRYAIAVIMMTAVTLFLSVDHNGPWITTDLKDLSPDLVKNEDVNHVISSLSSHIEGQFLLVLSGSDESAVVKGQAQVRDSIANQSSVMALIDSEQLVAMLLSFLKEYRFNLLMPSQRSLLTSAGDSEILVVAKQSLYRSMGARLLPITEDPFNFFTDYVDVLLADNPLNNNALQTKNGRWFSVIAVNVVGPALSMDKQAVIANAVNQFKSDLAKHDVDLYRSGIIFFANEAATNTQRDIQLITTVSIISIVVLLVFVFRSLVPLLVASVSIAAGIVIASLLSFTLFGSVHIITLLFGASLIGVVVDYALHYFYHYIPGQSNRSLYKAMGLSLFTSVIGYSALAFSDLLSLQRVAVFSAIGLVTAWLMVVVLGSIFLSTPLTVNSRVMDTCLSLLDRFVAVCIKPFVVVLVPLVVISFLGLCVVGIQHNDEPRLFFSPSKILLAEEKIVADLINDYEPGRYIIVKGRSVDEIYQSLQQLHKVSDEFYSVSDWLPSPEDQRKAYQLNSRLYSDNGLAKQFYQSIGANDNAASDLSLQYQAANTSANDKPTADKIATPELLMVFANNRLPPFWFNVNNHYYSLARIPKGFNIAPLNALTSDNILVIDTVAMASAALAEQRLSAATLLLIAYALVALLLLAIYRHWRALLLVMVPALSTMVTLLFFAAINQPMTLFHYMALFLVLGLGMDYMIFAKDMVRNLSIRNLTLQAIVLAALTSLLSFGLLGLSSLAVVAGFGLTLFVGSLANVVMAMTYSQYNLQKNSRQN